MIPTVLKEQVKLLKGSHFLVLSVRRKEEKVAKDKLQFYPNTVHYLGHDLSVKKKILLTD